MDLADLPERWRGRIAVDGAGCWLWLGARNGSGYARVNGNARAHREVYMALVGEIPDGLDLDHLCRVRHCVNPEHLEPVTRGENVKRGERRLAHVDVCRNGHPRTPENTGQVRGARVCLICTRARSRNWARAKRAELATCS